MPTVTVNPTLVVGVGGTGCHVAKMLRKMIEQDVDPEDRDRIPMRFIGIDTDLKDANEIKGEEAPLHFVMEIAGRARALGGEDDNSRASASFRKWLPKNKAGEFVMDPAHLSKGEGAGGKRLLGRYGFKYFAPFQFDAVQRHVEALRDVCNNPIMEWKGVEFVASDRLEVFVVCSMAGGTGSGAFLDALAMCHRLCDRAAPGLARGIHLVIVTPSAFEHVINAKNKSVHKATAFACLKDLDNLMSDSVSKTFEFHNAQDVTVEGRLADDVFLIGRHGSTGTVTELSELFRIMAIQLYGMIGSPMGTAFDTINNNNATLDQADTAGGKKRYSAFGLVGLDYDLATRHYRAESSVAQSAANFIRWGEAGAALDEETVLAEASLLTKPYRNGSASPRVSELLGARESALTLPSVSEEEVPKDIVERIRTLSGSRTEADLQAELRTEGERRWKGVVKEKTTGWRGEFEATAYDLVSRFGTQGARAILAKAEELLREAKEELEDRSVSSTISAAADDAMARLNRIGLFMRMTQAERANLDKLAAIEVYDNGVRSHLREIASAVMMETVFGPTGISAALSTIAEGIRTADDIAGRAGDELSRRSAEGVSPSSTALDRSGVIYDVVRDWDGVSPTELPGRGRECYRTWMAGTSAKAAEPGRRTVEALSGYYTAGGKRAPHLVFADALAAQAGVLVKDETTEHILDVIMPNDESGTLRKNLFNTLKRLTPLALADQLDPDEYPYSTTLALVPTGENGVHPKQDEFSRTFSSVCSELKHSQPGISFFGGRPNRLLMAKWILGFALNDRAFPPLVELRENYIVESKRNAFLDVDARWMDQPGPGMSNDGGRRLVWALGLAYGLIAQDKGSRYYNNLRTLQNRNPEVKGTLEEHEVDADLILKAIKGKRPVAEWLPSLMQGSCAQRLGNRDVPLAYTSDKLGPVERNKRDLIGTGRAEAFEGFLRNVGEDYGDVETGMVLVLNAYLDSRGHGEVVAELEAYRNRLAAVKTPDERMAAQIEDEVSMIGLALENIATKDGFGLPDPQIV
ncbi:hypothetical protein EON81_06400 [bacterium]|nr:MAG: hypothetical protein EON81_06400 [bacterium]